MKIGLINKRNIILFFCILVACKKEQSMLKESFYDNGKLKKVEYYGDDVKLDSSYHYSNNGKKVRSVIFDRDYELVTNYYENGNIESQGRAKNGRKIDWWLTYNKNRKLRNKYQFIIIKGKEYVNQAITYDTEGNIIKDKSNYFEIDFPTTIKKGKTKINVFYEPFSEKSDIYICVGYDINDDFSNLTNAKIDTFYFAADNPNKWLGLRYENVGKKKVRGFIYERLIEWKKISKHKDSLQMYTTDVNLFFEKEIIVE